MDVFVFQKLEEKTSRINDIWFRGDRGNVLDLESLDPEEIKLALITDVDRLVKMFFDQEKEELNRSYRRLVSALEALKAVQSDIKDYADYRDRCLESIRSFHTSLLASDFFKELPKVAEDGEIESKQIKKAKELKEDIEALLSGSELADKDILSVGRKIENSYPVLGIYFQARYNLAYFKEYVSKVRKTERTLLKPKGYSLSSDLAPVLTQYQADLEALKLHAGTYAGDEKSPRWEELRGEIQQKKSALQVEGRTAESRAQEFDRLNYLLEYRQALAPKPADTEVATSELELEALALELELELFDI